MGAPDVRVPPSDDAVALLLAEVVRHLCDGKREKAAHALAPIAGATIATSPLTPMSTLPRDAWPRGRGATTRQPPSIVTAAVFARDHFTCCYCGRRTIPNPMLRLISVAFPMDFPFHPNWRKDICSRAYWDISTSIDHVHAVSVGGDWQDPSNLATACARCQYQKSNLTLETLGWTVRHPVQDWDGLARFHETLWVELGRPDPTVHRPWLRTFARLERNPPGP
jgi:5-methylcytosine-specific restriction endonuclease McrA